MQQTLLICCATILVTAYASGQQVYTLVPGTKANRIELTIANEAPTMAENVEIKLVRHSAYLTFSSTDHVIRSLRPSEEGLAEFTFDVARSAPVNKRDTVDFQVREENGSVWPKSIIVRYAVPTTFALDQNFPNPFNPATKIQYQLPTDSWVSLKVYDVLGREVAMLVNEDRPAGYHDVHWNTRLRSANSPPSLHSGGQAGGQATDVASGVYFYRIEAQPLIGGQGFQSVKKLMVVR